MIVVSLTALKLFCRSFSSESLLLTVFTELRTRSKTAICSGLSVEEEVALLELSWSRRCLQSQR